MATQLADSDSPARPVNNTTPEAVVVRFAGDSGLTILRCDENEISRLVGLSAVIENAPR